jgi:single-strand DNA-binding protein
MASFNKVILMGRLTHDPELKQSTSGVSVTSFNLAVDRRYNKGEDKQCDFITIVAWRQTAEFICKYFGKGQAILVCGELQTRSWTDNQGNKRYATEVVSSEVSFCEAKRDTETNSPSDVYNGSYGTLGGSQPNFEDIGKDDDLPF